MRQPDLLDRKVLSSVWTVRGRRREPGTPGLAGCLYAKHLAEKILTSKSALEGERKRVTVLFADLRGSLELLADRDPKEAGKVLISWGSPLNLQPRAKPAEH